MGGYADSTYYGKLDVLVDLLMDGKITQEVYDEKSLEYLDVELCLYDGWLARHFNSTAEYLYEAVQCESDTGDDDLPRPFYEMVAHAEKEIAIFRKRHHDDIADEFEWWLNEAKESHACTKA